MQEQQKKVASQQAQIGTLQRTAQLLEDRLKAGQASIPNAPGAQNAQGPDRQQKLTDVQQKQLKVLEEQLGLVVDEVEKQAPIIQNLQTQTATLESRAQQAARRDRELANLDDAPIEQFDAERRNGPQLPALLKGMFAPVQTTSSPLTIVNTLAVRYDLFTHQRGAGVFEFQEFTPFFLIQLNKRILLSGELIFAPQESLLVRPRLIYSLTIGLPWTSVTSWPRSAFGTSDWTRSGSISCPMNLW
jgi:hypothetical protein